MGRRETVTRLVTQTRRWQDNGIPELKCFSSGVRDDGLI